MAEVRMPKMGDGMEEGTILRWLKNEGEAVKVGEPIAEIETDKATVEVPAEESGTMGKIVVGEGTTVAVGVLIAYLGDSSGVAEAPSAVVSATNGASVEAPTPAAAPVVAPIAAPIVSAAPATSERVKASPLAKSVAGRLGIDLGQVKGTGPAGRIVVRDVQAFASEQPAKPVAAPVAKPLAVTATPTLDGTDTEISRMRKAIAKRTVQSKQTIPHFYLVLPIEMDAAMALLGQLNAGATDSKITINDLIVKACAVALTKFPDVNVSFTPDDKIRRYDSINIGVAVGTDAGLTIPVVPDCGNKTLRQISADAKALIVKARNGQLTPAEMSGGTFSVSNLGMMGIEEFVAIINPPESAILAIGAANKEVKVLDDGSFKAVSRMRVTLSCDHRTVDGLLGAKFLAEIKLLLESPISLLA